MTTILFNHPASLGHATPAGHPERPDRARALEKAFAAEQFAALERRSPEPASLETVALAHPREWVDQIAAAAPTSGLVQIDSDTVMSPGTMDCVLRAVGAATAGVDAVIGGEAKNTFSAMRPPGHHAERTRAMGFCIFNFAAVAARHAQKAHGVERVAIVDWDVHHGNGSQDIFWSDPTVMYASTHQSPLYPGTGAVGERGDHDTIVNAPLRPGADGEAFRDAMQSRIMPRLEQFGPDLIIISAGFDAHWRDPLASLRFEAEDFAWATKLLMSFADKTCGGRIVSVLEGGYDLQGLAESAAAHVTTLMEG